jgi:hypothetical protein
MEIVDRLKQMATIDLFAEAKQPAMFVGRPFHLDYTRAVLLVADAWKRACGGIAQGTFLLAFYENESDVSEALLLRALRPAVLPTDADVVSSMIEYYKDNLKTTGAESKLDDYTRYDFSFSGLECSILGTFFREPGGSVAFGADVENFYSSHHYSVYKPVGKALEFIVNLTDAGLVGSPTDVPIGLVRYSSTQRFEKLAKSAANEIARVFVSARDFLGKRTALFGMTRTGKSNTVKKIVQATMELNRILENSTVDDAGDKFSPFQSSGLPKKPSGQIIFDVNGEYANANLQDSGTAVFEQYPEHVVRYSVQPKPGFEVLKTNFYRQVEVGWSQVCQALAAETGDYVSSFAAADMSPPDLDADEHEKVRYERKKAAYLCCLYRAGFKAPSGFTLRFQGNKELNELAGGTDPSKGVTLAQAADWFIAIWSEEGVAFMDGYKKDKGHDWAGEDLRAILAFLTRRKSPGRDTLVSGYLKLRSLAALHQSTSSDAFEDVILERLVKGDVVIIDLSQGNPLIQQVYSERICSAIFDEAMAKFVANEPSNFAQFYFEEAHNLFPKKDDKDLSQIYTRIAKEGAKLNLGMIYATQEVSSISANILKNTQNWFIAHLNNEDELKEIRKFYDFGDFSDSLIRFSATSDRGFVRMKTYSNPFVVPVQIDRFEVTREADR